MKKIRLNRETVRNLDPRKLDRIRGGRPDSKGPDCTDACTRTCVTCICPSINVCGPSDACDTLTECM